MTVELQDVRTKVSDLSHQVLTAVARARACDIAEVLREIIQDWADRKLEEAILIQRLTRREGGTGANEGKPGN